MGLLSRRSGGPVDSERDSIPDQPVVTGSKPSAMRGNEPLFGYVVGVALVVVAILNLTVTHGTGAPAHPQTTLEAVGVAASLAFFGAIQTKNRMIAGFGAILAAFFVTLPRVPTSLSVAHIVALVLPMAYGLIITQRQRRETPRLARGARGSAAAADARGGRSGKTRAGAAPAGGRRRRGKQPEAVSGPRPSARYTPPKSKRQQAK